MDIFRQTGVDEERVRHELSTLDWQGGLTTVDIMEELPALPRDLFGDLADGAIFHSPEDVIASLRGEVDPDAADIPSEGAESLGGPAGYGESSTGRLIRTPSTTGGVGSGTDSGDTGSGNTGATGWGRPGTTFGKEAVDEEQRDEEGSPEEYLDDLP